MQIVWQAIDEVREVIGQTVGYDAQEFWNVEPPQGLPLGRYRPFAGYEPCLRESQRQEGMDSLADPHRHEDLNHDLPPMVAQATEQRSLLLTVTSTVSKTVDH